jgi:hypothetical protein
MSSSSSSSSSRDKPSAFKTASSTVSKGKGSTLEPGAKTVDIARRRVVNEGINMSRIDARNLRANVADFASHVATVAADYDLEAAQNEAEALQRLKELKADAALQSAADSAQLDPELNAMIQELISLRQGGKITAQDTLDLMTDFKQFVKDKRAKKDERTFVKKHSDKMMQLFNQANNKIANSGVVNYISENKDSIYLLMRIAFAGVQLWTIWTLPSALLTAVTLYFGGVMPWTAETNTWATWIMSFLSSPAYYGLFGASMLAWFWANWTSIGAGFSTFATGITKFITWIMDYIKNGGQPTKNGMMAAFKELNLADRASILADLNSKVEALKDKSPANPDDPGITPAQLEAAATIQLTAQQTAAESPLMKAIRRGTPINDAVAATASTPQVAEGEEDEFGPIDPNASSSSSSAASGGDDIVGGRRRRRTKRRGTRRRGTNRRSTRRGKTTKRAKRSRRNR